VKRRTFYGRKQLIVRRVQKVPAKSDASEIAADEDRSIPIIPSEAQKSCLTRLVSVETFRQGTDV
jgi:hypothetical protein